MMESIVDQDDEMLGKRISTKLEEELYSGKSTVVGATLQWKRWPRKMVGSLCLCLPLPVEAFKQRLGGNLSGML